MNGIKSMSNLIQIAQEKCLNGIVLSKDEIVQLLSIPLASEQDNLLRKTARDVASIKVQNKGYIWSAIGLDFAPCPMNCKFCSFGDKWNIIKEKRILTSEEILTRVKVQVENGAHYIVLRTTEFFSIPDLISLVQQIKKNIPGTYRIVLNIGEFDLDTANTLYENGVWGIYHTIRLREGIDTCFDIKLRQKTQTAVMNSPLHLITLVEPVGIEHSNEEIADAFLTNVQKNTLINGAMARVPVLGTPLGDKEAITSERLAQIIAVLRLSGGNIVQDICVHPATLSALKSGANVMVVETGAVPRDAEYSPEDWEKMTIQSAHQLLQSANYETRHTF